MVYLMVYREEHWSWTQCDYDEWTSPGYALPGIGAQTDMDTCSFSELDVEVIELNLDIGILEE